MPSGSRTSDKACASSNSAAARRSSSQWQSLEAENESPLREIVAGNWRAAQALESLESTVLGPHGWTLTKYTVRLLAELHSRSIKDATIQLRNEDYAQQTLHDAVWDGVNAWDIESDARFDTLEILLALEVARTTDNPQFEHAQAVAAHLLAAGGSLDTRADRSSCKTPSIPKDPQPAGAS